MSGSPVYIDGRLIGAVSYSIGAFSKEPIAGITPIEEMKDATAMPRARPSQARLELPVTREASPPRSTPPMRGWPLCSPARRRSDDRHPCRRGRSSAR